MEEFKVGVENLTEEELKQFTRLVNKANNPKNVWFPQKWKKYYYLDMCGKIKRAFWRDATLDKYLYSLGNCFETKEKAEWSIEHLKIKAELKRYADTYNEAAINFNISTQPKYFLKFSYWSFDVYIENCRHEMCADTIYFVSENIAKKAIKEIGEERLKKYYFGIED